MKIEYRAAGGSTYTTLADDSTTSAPVSRIAGYQPALRISPLIEALPVAAGAAFASFISGRAGQWVLSFSVDRQHASADAALAFLQSHPVIFAIAGNFDLQITVGLSVVHMPNCALTEFTPDPHSDQHTNIKYAFTGSSYTT